MYSTEYSVKDSDLRFPLRKIRPGRETRMFFEGSAALLVCHAHTHTHTHNMTFRKLFTAFPRLDIKTSSLKKEHGKICVFLKCLHTH